MKKIELYIKHLDGSLKEISIIDLLKSIIKAEDVCVEVAGDESWLNLGIQDDEKLIDISLSFDEKGNIEDVGVFKTPIKKVLQSEEHHKLI